MSQKLVSINPATEEVIGEILTTDSEQVQVIVSQAQNAFVHWKKLKFKQRKKYLLRLRELFYSEREEIADLVTRECGKPRIESYTCEILPVLDLFDYYIHHSEKFLKPEESPIHLLLMRHKKSYVRHEPLGVVAIITSWNYPFLIPLQQIIPALLAGNTVVCKPSELTPLCGLKIFELFQQVDFPEKVFNIVIGKEGVGIALVESAINKIAFTGSTATGKKIMEAAAKRLTPLTLELGGKDPMIVCEDADLERASSGAVWGAFVNGGQTCISVERLYVHEKIFEPFSNLVIEKTRRLRLGPGTDPDCEIGPLISENQRNKIEDQIQEALSRGAKILVGRKHTEFKNGYFYEPTVITNLDPSMQLYQEETFGPVLPLIPFKEDTEVIQMANDSKYGLAASVWSKNIKRAKKIAEQLECGSVSINDCLSFYGVSESVCGGVKESGFGRTHGRQGILDFTYPKYISIDRRTWEHKLWWYGYSADLERAINSATEFLFSRSFFRRFGAAFRLLPHLFRKDRI